MKAQFKYAFLTGLHTRGYVFAVVFAMNIIFIFLGSLRLLPNAAHITAVSLGGVAIAVMTVMNVISDVAIARRMFSAPEAYLHALTPAPRRNILLASLVTMLAFDFVTISAVIACETWLAFNLTGSGAGGFVRSAVLSNLSGIWYSLLYLFLMISGYLLVLTVIMTCVTVRKSLFFAKRAGGLLTALFALCLIYVISLTSFLLAPFGSVSRFGIFFNITVGTAGVAVHALLTLIEAAALFVFASRLMERNMNI